MSGNGTVTAELPTNGVIFSETPRKITIFQWFKSLFYMDFYYRWKEQRLVKKKFEIQQKMKDNKNYFDRQNREYEFQLQRVEAEILLMTKPEVIQEPERSQTDENNNGKN